MQMWRGKHRAVLAQAQTWVNRQINGIGNERSKETLMPFFHLDDFDLSMPHLRQYGKVMMMWSFSSLNLKLINHILMTDLLSPNLLYHRMLELTMQGMMVVAEHHKLVPVVGHLFVNRHLYERHWICTINYTWNNATWVNTIIGVGKGGSGGINLVYQCLGLSVDYRSQKIQKARVLVSGFFITLGASPLNASPVLMSVCTCLNMLSLEMVCSVRTQLCISALTISKG